MHDDGAPTPTSQQQHALEQRIAALYADLTPPLQPSDPTLAVLSDRHASYLHKGLGQLPSGFAALDASRPWIVYWVLHGLALLGAPLPDDIGAADVVAFLDACQDPTGGFGGGPRQLPHLAPTYAAVCSLVTLGGEAALGVVRRGALWQFLLRMAVPPEQGGGFVMHAGGECDVRACYTAMAVAHGLCLDVQELVAASGMVDYVRRCQTYEGGLGGEPGNEAHGGYTYCGVAALLLAGRQDALDVPRLLHWAAQRQCWVEGGFNGRTNKLADGCYSFWQGGLFPLLQRLGPEYTRQSQVPRPVAGTNNMGTCASSEGEQEEEPWDLVVPELPPLDGVLGPEALAEQDNERKQEAAEALVQAALAMHDQESSARQGSSAEAEGQVHGSSAKEVLDRASAVQQAAELADTRLDIARHSAAVLLAGWGGCMAHTQHLHQKQQPSSEWADRDQASISGQGSAPETHHDGVQGAAGALCNPAALQLWVLRACQQAKGGLRDKPGKQADFYHSCYCLSGLSAAQHMPGSFVLGPQGNVLKRADPLMNVLEDKLAQAQAHYSNQPLQYRCEHDLQVHMA